MLGLIIPNPPKKEGAKPLKVPLLKGDLGGSCKAFASPLRLAYALAFSRGLEDQALQVSNA